MADIFFFSSATAPLSAKCYQYLSKAKLNKRRRVKMDISQRAYVTHFEEPIFCASSTSSLTPQDPYAEILLLPGLSNSSRLIPGYERPQIASTDRLRPYHPRPYSRDAWEEEDARRVRFALASDDEEKEHLLSQAADNMGKDGTVEDSTHVPSMQMSSRERLLPTNDTHVNAESSLNVTGPPAALEHLVSLLPMDVDVPTRFPSPRSSSSRGSISIPVMDDDAAAVDDPRRNYDFADFMDTWRFLQQAEGLEPEPELGDEQFSRLKAPIDDVQSAEMVEQGVDMQGLRWHLRGSNRDDALRARLKLHPFKILKTKESNENFCDSHQYYRFRAFSPRHRARFNHHQLRNVLTVSHRNEIFYSTGDHVFQTSLSIPAIERSVMDLSKSTNRATPFRITCLGASQSSAFTGYQTDSVLLAGGFYGEYAMRGYTPAASRSQHTEIITNDWNGVITSVKVNVRRRSGLLQAEFCSNDRKLRTLDCRSQRFTQTFAYENAINHSATAPDDRLRVLVGDFVHPIVTDAERGDVLFRLRAHHDFGFACAWSPDSRHVATGAQDGLVQIWDSRNWMLPVHTLSSQMSCPRSLNFTDDGLLVVAEDDDVVSIFNTRDSGSRRQDIHFFGSIAGLALVDGGNEIVVANADKTVGGLLSFRKERLSRGQLLGSDTDVVV